MNKDDVLQLQKDLVAANRKANNLQYKLEKTAVAAPFLFFVGVFIGGVAMYALTIGVTP